MHLVYMYSYLVSFPLWYRQYITVMHFKPYTNYISVHVTQVRWRWTGTRTD